MLEVEGRGAGRLFRDEAGGHRWQRIPPTERRGRVHTSTVTVAVLPVRTQGTASRLDPRDVEWKATRGTGAGGQNRNKRDTAVQAWHLPTGIMVRCEKERSQYQNRVIALALLEARVAQGQDGRAADALNRHRQGQIGSGQRGDKIRTIRTQDGVVTDHRSGAKWSWEQYRRGAHLPAPHGG